MPGTDYICCAMLLLCIPGAEAGAEADEEADACAAKPCGLAGTDLEGSNSRLLVCEGRVQL